MTKPIAFYSHNYTMLFPEYSTELDTVFTDILDNAPSNATHFEAEILGGVALFDLPVQSPNVEFHHNSSLCYLVRAVAVCVLPESDCKIASLFAKEPDFLAARMSLWSDDDAIRDVVYINKKTPNCTQISEVRTRLLKEALTKIPHHGQQLRADGYVDEDFPISALLHLQRALGCDPTKS